jgi:hypothetical protein
MGDSGRQGVVPAEGRGYGGADGVPECSCAPAQNRYFAPTELADARRKT